MDRMRDECIALESARITAECIGLRSPKTFGMIADEAISRVDQACKEGRLGILSRSWIHDRDKRG
jgi:hypothetical protein